MHLKFSGKGCPSSSRVPDKPSGSFLPASTSSSLQHDNYVWQKWHQPLLNSCKGVPLGRPQLYSVLLSFINSGTYTHPPKKRNMRCVFLTQMHPHSASVSILCHKQTVYDKIWLLLTKSNLDLWRHMTEFIAPLSLLIWSFVVSYFLLL